MATKKSAAKGSAKKAPAKAAVKKASAAKDPAQKSAAKRASGTGGETHATKPAVDGVTAGKATDKKAASKKTASQKTASKGKGEENYTQPELREKIKEDVMAGDKGGRPGQWSARKAQLVAHEYVAEGGAYKHPRNEAQEHLKQWGDEHWHTADGKPAIRDDGEGHEETHRYLPDEAWKELSPEKKKATDEKKVRASRSGKQFVANTDKAKQARKHATE